MKYCKPLRYLLSAAALLSGFSLGLGGAPQPALAVTDLPPSHWAASTINAYVSRGVMAGYPDGTFRPEASVTRAEFVKMVNNVFGYDTLGSISFPDVSASYWGYDDIAKGVFAGYINGDENGYFKPEDPLTREEAASIICRIKGLAPNQTPVSQYSDSDKIAAWSAPYVGAVTQFGYMEGNGDGTFNPTKALSRAEAASVLAKAESSKTYTSTPSSGINSGSSSGNSGSSSNNSGTSNTLHRDGYTSSTKDSDKVSDYTMSSGENKLSGKTITGNLYLPSNLGAKTVRLEDLTVDGTVYVRGGGTIDVDDCDFNKVVLDKSGVTFTANSKSKIDDLEFWRNGRIEGGGYGDVTINDDSVSTVNIDAAVDNLVLDTDANVRLGRNADIDNFEATSNADRANINFAKDAYVGNMDLYDRVEITGSGEINKMYTHVSGISSSIEPNKLTTSGSGTRPTYTNNTGSDDNDDNNNSSNNNNNNNNNSSSNTTVKDLVVTSNTNGSNGKKGNATYNTVTVTRAGVTVSNVIIDKNLVVDAAVADGTVTFDHVTVKGQVYIHGGGQNSVIFSDCTLEKDIYIDKKPTETVKQPVGLKLNNGTTLKGSVVVQNNAHIATSPKEHLVNKLIVDGTLTEPLVLDAHVDNLTVSNSSDLTVTLDNSNINVLVAKTAKVTVKGKGNINDTSGVPNLNIDMLTPPDETTKPDLPNFKAIISLSGIPETIEQGGTIRLDTIQAKYSDSTTANISNVTWTLKDNTNNGVSITDSLLTANNVGSFTLTGTVKNGSGIGKDFISTPFLVTVTEVFVPVKEISANFPSSVMLKEDGEGNSYLDLPIKDYNVTVLPNNATHKEIVWTLTGNGASLKDNVLHLTEQGDVKLVATITNGQADKDYRVTFPIKVNATYHAVEKIALKDLAYDQETQTFQAYAGTPFTLNTTVTPNNATNKTVNWELVNDNTASLTADDLKGANPKITPQNTGEILLKATITGGLTDGKEDFEQAIKIKVNPALIGDIIVTPDPITETVPATYYRGQKLRFSLPANIMAAYNGKIKWVIANEDELKLFLAEDKMPKLDTPDAVMTYMTIPEDFPISRDTKTIKIGVHNGAVDDIYKTTDKTVEITIAEFMPVTAITNKFTLEGTMPADEMRYTVDLSQIELAPTNATMQDVTWKIKTDVNNSAAINENELIITKPGEVTVTAVVAKGKSPTEDFTQDFTFKIAVPVISNITPETAALGADGSYLAGQKLSFTMDPTVIATHGDEMKWQVDSADITGTKDETTKKFTFTIPANFSGKTIKLTAENAGEKRELEINVTPFTSLTATNITINTDNVPADGIKVGSSAQLTCTTPKLAKDVQSIVWSISEDCEPTDADTEIDADGNLTIGKNEKLQQIEVIATVVNGALNADKNELSDVESAPESITVNLMNVSNIFYQRDTKDTPTLIEADKIPEFYAGENITFSVDALSTSVGGRDTTWVITNLDDILKKYPTCKIAIIGGKLTGTDVLTEEQQLDITATTAGTAKKVSVKILPFTAVTKLEITPNGSTTVETGQTLKFNATVEPSTKASAVTWSITGQKQENTKINETSGELTVAAGETGTITVQATIKGGKITSDKLQDVTSTAKVTPFTSVQDITIDYQKEGNNVRFTATVNPTGATVSKVSWSISGQKSGTSINASTGLLTIAEDDDSQITVTATITGGKLNTDGTKVNVTKTATVQNGNVTVQNANTTSRIKAAPQPTTFTVRPTAEEEKQEEEEKTNSKNNTIKKSAAEIRAEQAAAEREQIEAEKRAQRARQSSISKGSGVSKTQVSAD